MKKIFTLLTVVLISQALSHAQVKLISKPHSSDTAGNLHVARTADQSGAAIKSLPPDGISIGQVQKTQPSIKSTCAITTNAQYAALTTAGLIAYLRATNDYECTARILFNYQPAYSPSIFTTTNIQAVANELRNIAPGYDGTFTNGVYGLLCYLHIGAYFDCFQHATVAFDQATWDAIRQATDALCVNPHLFDSNREAAAILDEFLLDLDNPTVRSSPVTINLLKLVMRNMLINDTWKTTTDINWVTCYWRIYYLMSRGASDNDYLNAILNDDEYIPLLGCIAVDQEIMANPVINYLYQDNAIIVLCGIATNPLFTDQVCALLAKVCQTFQRLHKNWLYSVYAIIDAGKCIEYNLCEDKNQLRMEVLNMLFPNTCAYNDGKLIFNAKFPREVADNLYFATRQTEAQFFRLAQTDQPVNGDPNTVLKAFVFESKSVYDNYAPFLFGISTNNGGMYIEPIAEFYTWDRPATYPLSLEELFRHEFNHYLQERFLIPGFWGQVPFYDNNRLTWYEEGQADLLCASTDIEGIKLKQTTVDRLLHDYPNSCPSLAAVFESFYGQAGEIYYNYGNLVWYNWYKNDYGKIKTFIDLTRNNDIAGFDNLVNSIKNDPAAEAQWRNFLTDVHDGIIPPWQIVTDWKSDEYMSVGELTDIQSEFSAITGLTNITVSSDAASIIGRFRISGTITGTGTAVNNPAAALTVNQALDGLLNQLKNNQSINNFHYLTGYVTNVTFPGNIPTGDYYILGSLKDPDTGDGPLADFSAATKIVMTGNPVNFESLSSGYIKGYSWSFPGGTPSVSTSVNPQVTYNSAGLFPVTLTVTGNNPSQTNTKSVDVYIKVIAPSTNTYCISTYGYDHNWISRVSIKDIDNNTTGFPPNGYSDFTSSFVTELVKGSTYPITIDLSYTNHEDRCTGVWIDLNHNGTFDDPGEQLLFERPPVLTQLSGATISIPSGALAGVTRMRVKSGYRPGPLSPCGVDEYCGEIEDYSVVIVNNDCSNPLPVQLGENSGYQGSWYTYSSNVPQQVTITSCDPRNNQDPAGEYSYDTYLFVYSDCDGTILTSNDNMEPACGTNPSSSSATFNVLPCKPVYIYWPMAHPDAAHSGELFYFTVTATDTDPNFIPLTLTLGGTSTIFCGNMATVNAYAAGGTPPYSFLWQNMEYSSSITVQPLTSTTYAVTLTDASGCSVTGGFTVEVTSIISLSTHDVGSFGCSMAIAGGLITCDGGNPVITSGICWSTNNAPTIADSHTHDGIPMGSFFSTLTGLLANTTYFIRVYAENSSGVEYGNEVSYTNTSCEGTIQDSRDNKEYGYLTIGSQTWMCENMHYIPAVSRANEESYTCAFHYVYDYQGNDLMAATATPNYLIYGVLYNWVAAGMACPAGWHLPSDEDWTTLVDFLGTTAGGKLKHYGASFWSVPNVGGINSSGFTALPGGWRDRKEGFIELGYASAFWSSTEYGSLFAGTQGLSYQTDGATRYATTTKTNGLSVRCLKDEGNAINEGTAVSRIRIYPNPANESVYIDINSMESNDLIIDLVSVSGAVVYHKEIKSAYNLMHEIDIKGCSKGVYYLRINFGKGQKIEKIIIQ